MPGLDFDVTAPRISGASARTVRAPKGANRARVAYKVTASDAKDGARPVSCVPKSGSRFRIGRTTVRCSATDRSGNTRQATFTITVKAHRALVGTAAPQIIGLLTAFVSKWTGTRQPRGTASPG